MATASNTAKTRKTLDKSLTFILVAAIIVVVNILAVNLFIRFDLTANDIYSLSKPSKEAVRNLSEPMTVRAFFSPDLPSQYAIQERYLREFLQEYKQYGGRNFRYEFIDIEENPEAPEQYGIRPVQIQILEQDQATVKNAYMGLVFLMGDLVERIPRIDRIRGVEYEITTKIMKMTEKVSKLAMLEEDIHVTLVASSSMEQYVRDYNITEIRSAVESSVNTLNEKLMGKLDFRFINPSEDADAAQQARAYGIPGDGEQAFFGLAVSLGDDTEVVNLLARFPFGGYVVSGIDGLDRTVEDVVDNLIGLNKKVGYITGHGEAELFAGGGMMGQQQQDGESVSQLAGMIRERYQLESLGLTNGGIPSDIDALLIVGPREEYSEYELYQIDQYVMKGKPVAFALDGLDFPQPPPQMQQYYRQPPTGVPVRTGLEYLLSQYGIKMNHNIVFDMECFEQRVPEQYGGGMQELYFAPIIQQESISQEHPVTEKIRGMIMLRMASLEPAGGATNASYTTVLQSSQRAWQQGQGVNLQQVRPVAEENMQQYTFAASIDGPITSYFQGRAIPSAPGADGDSGAFGEAGIDFIESTDKARIFVLSGSDPLKNMLVTPQNVQNATFAQNIVDWLVMDTALLTIRNKGLRYNPPRETGEGVKMTIRLVNVVGVPLLVLLVGFFLWRFSIARRKKIREEYSK